MIKFSIFIILFFGLCAHADNCAKDLAANHDEYRNFADLKRHEKEGADFKIEIRRNESPVTIIGPHAGKIEFGTSEIARAIAKTDFNLYLFEGIKDGENFGMHITSANFDEPQAVALVTRSRIAISIHGYNDEQNSLVILGGLNRPLTAELAQAFKKSGLAVEYPAQRFKGVHSSNIVNRAGEKGVQIEISSRLRHELLFNRNRLNHFAEAVRKAIFDYIESDWCPQSDLNTHRIAPTTP